MTCYTASHAGQVDPATAAAAAAADPPLGFVFNIFFSASTAEHIAGEHQERIDIFVSADPNCRQSEALRAFYMAGTERHFTANYRESDGMNMVSQGPLVALLLLVASCS